MREDTLAQLSGVRIGSRAFVSYRRTQWREVIILEITARGTVVMRPAVETTRQTVIRKPWRQVRLTEPSGTVIR